MRQLYNFFVYLATPLVFLFLFLRGRRQKAYRKRWRERLGYVKYDASGGQRPIWVHAVSVGEIQAAAPLINWLLQNYPEQRIFVTTITPTGSKRALEMFGDAIDHSYLPYDIAGAVQRFLRRVNPCAGIIMETEIWPNLYHHCHQQNIPLVLANARLSDKSLKRYLKIPGPGLLRSTLQKLSCIAAQSQQDANRLLELGANADSVHVTGNMKFDLAVPADLQDKVEGLRPLWGPTPTWIAASTHDGEEKMALEAHRQILKFKPDVNLILAPRHPERTAAVKQMVVQAGFEPKLHSHSPHNCNPGDVYIVDTLGELLTFYSLADVVFVGGSLVPIGGHNMMEPAALGRAILSGTHLDNFVEAAETLTNANAIQLIEDTDTFAVAVLDLLSDAVARDRMGRAAQAVVEGNRGALANVCKLVAERIA